MKNACYNLWNGVREITILQYILNFRFSIILILFNTTGTYFNKNFFPHSMLTYFSELFFKLIIDSKFVIVALQIKRLFKYSGNGRVYIMSFKNNCIFTTAWWYSNSLMRFCRIHWMFKYILRLIFFSYIANFVAFLEYLSKRTNFSENILEFNTVSEKYSET